MLWLVARGLTDGEIAATLVVSEHTIKTHVAHLLQKLDLRERTQAVVIAYEPGLVKPGEGIKSTWLRGGTGSHLSAFLSALPLKSGEWS